MRMEAETLRVREVAERLGIDTLRVVQLLSSGQIYGRPDRTGEMRVTVESIELYEADQAQLA